MGKFYIKDSNLTVTIWLDAKKGTCLKITNSGYDSSREPYEYVEEYVATYGVVTDEDVAKPDLTGYTLIESDSSDVIQDINIDNTELPNRPLEDASNSSGYNGPGIVNVDGHMIIVNGISNGVY